MSAEALWAYCVAPAGGRPPEGLTGVDADQPVERVEAGGLVALVSRVPLAEFGEEPLRDNLNDFPWLERVARRHEAVLEATFPHTTIVPLRMCTIFTDERGVKRMLEDQHEALTTALVTLRGRDEWAVKVLVDRTVLEAAARDLDPALAPEVPAGQGSGAAYLSRRRSERQLREAADRLALELAEAVHGEVREVAAGAVVNRPQSRELSGHAGDMVLNGAYLVEREREEELRALVADLQARHQRLGARVELSGPLPPFNFGGPG